MAERRRSRFTKHFRKVDNADSFDSVKMDEDEEMFTDIEEVANENDNDYFKAGESSSKRLKNGCAEFWCFQGSK